MDSTFFVQSKEMHMITMAYILVPEECLRKCDNFCSLVFVSVSFFSGLSKNICIKTKRSFVGALHLFYDHNIRHHSNVNHIFHVTSNRKEYAVDFSISMRKYSSHDSVYL